MNTLMGDPSTEKLAPLIEAASSVGAEYFCIDAGWFAGDGDWWDTVGEWREDPQRFTGGLASVIEMIRERGMSPGIWLEPEVVGRNSPMVAQLPAEAFFTRFGEKVMEHGRYHLDFRHPAARAHLDGVVDRLVTEFGISFLKLDYNINPGAGTEWQSEAAGDGLLGHSRAFVAWLADIQLRHPALLIENCSSGAMRMDYAYLEHSHLQSTSDQQDFLLYPPIAAAAPAAVAPEQCGNWAYPAADMSNEETAFSLVAGLAGRLYLSGFLDRLREPQTALVAEAVASNKRWRTQLSESTPLWPLGLPGWDDETLAVGFDAGDEILLALWSRGQGPAVIEFPDFVGEVALEFPADQHGLSGWTWERGESSTTFAAPEGPSARVFRLRKG
jgi:alpha-galactosidase